MKRLDSFVLVILILFWAVFAFAAVTQVANASTPSWFEHVDLMSLVIWALILVVVWFFIRTLKKIDANQTTLFKKLDALSEDFYTLRGEHNAIKSRCNR